MGTKVQQTSDMLGYYAMRNGSDEANVNWSSCHEDKTRLYLYDGSLPRPLISISNHERQIVKQTMLDHEATFKQQVSDLHFLYNRQKDLMKEFKMDFLKYSAPDETSRSNSLSSRVPSEISERMCQMPQTQTMYETPVVNGAFSNGGVFVPNNVILHMDFQNETYIPSSGNGVSLKDCKAFDFKGEVSSSRMIDLELPAGKQIDCEDAIATEKGHASLLSADMILEKKREAELENNVKLSLGPLEDPCRSSIRNPDKGLEKNLESQIFIDLNEPLKEAVSEASAGPSFIEFLSQGSGSKNVGMQHFTTKSDTKSLSTCSDIFGHKHKGKGNLLDLLSGNKELERHHDKGDGLCGDSDSPVNKILPMSYEATHSIQKSTDIFSPLDQCNNEAWFGENANRSIRSFDRAFHSANSNDSGHISFHAFRPFSTLPTENFNNPMRAAFPSSRMPSNGLRHDPVAVQALPCTNEASMKLRSSMTNQALRSFDTCIKWHSNADTGPKQKVVERSAEYQNAFHHPSSCVDKLNSCINLYESAYSTGSDVNWSKNSQPFDAKMAKSLDSNKLMPNGVLEGFTARQVLETRDINISQKQPSGVLSWLLTKPLHKGPMDIGDHTSRSLDLSRSYHLPFSNWDASISDIPKAQDHENNSVQFLGNLLGPRANEGNRNASVDPMLDKGLGKKPMVFGNIDLNTDIPYMSDTSNRCPVNVFAPVPSSTAKAAFMNDLKPSGSSGVENSFSPGQSTSLTNEFLEKCAQRVAAHLAAESIVALSRADSRMDSRTGNSACHDPLDPLNVLGKIAVENAHEVEHLNRSTLGYSDNEGSDSFEALTLKLKETKLETERPTPKEEPERTNKNEKCMASLLMKTRRGLARRRKQKRDFQKEILPVISTLSKREASEDIKALGGPQRAPRTGKATRLKSLRPTRIQRPQNRDGAIAVTHTSSMT